jgi:uncharacterized lipoprotein NlpE involved in copper resistance
MRENAITEETFSVQSVPGLHNENQQFSCWLNELKLGAEAGDSSESQRGMSAIEAATKQQLVKTEKTSCVLWLIVSFGGCNLVRLPELLVVTIVSVK